MTDARDIVERLRNFALNTLALIPDKLEQYPKTDPDLIIKGFSRQCDLLTEAADTIASLRKQLEDAREAIIEANNGLYGSQGYFLSLDGGPPNKYHLAEGIERLKSNAKALRSLPTDDGVTDEMVERAAKKMAMLNGPERNWPCFIEEARAALEAALGPLPAPPAC